MSKLGSSECDAKSPRSVDSSLPWSRELAADAALDVRQDLLVRVKQERVRRLKEQVQLACRSGPGRTNTPAWICARGDHRAA